MQVRASLVMHIHHMRTEGFNLWDELFGRNDHQMHIKRLTRVARHGFHYRETEADVGDKHPVHHIEMVPIGGTLVEHFDVTLQVGKIRTEQRRRNHCHELIG